RAYSRRSPGITAARPRPRRSWESAGPPCGASCTRIASGDLAGSVKDDSGRYPAALQEAVPGRERRAAASRRRRRRLASGAGDMHELELHPVGIREEDGVVAGRVGVLPRRIEDRHAGGLELPRQGIDLRAAGRGKGDLAEADPVLVKDVGSEARAGLLDPEASGRAEPADHRARVRAPGVAERRQEPGVELARA